MSASSQRTSLPTAMPGAAHTPASVFGSSGVPRRARDRLRRGRVCARRLFFDFAMRFAQQFARRPLRPPPQLARPTPSNSIGRALARAESEQARPRFRSAPCVLRNALRPCASKPRAASRARAAGRACRPPAWPSVTLRRASSVTLVSLRAASAVRAALRAQHQQRRFASLQHAAVRRARRSRTHPYWQSRSPRRDSARSARRRSGIEFDQHLPGAHARALLDLRRKALAVQLDRIDTDMQQNLRALRRAQASPRDPVRARCVITPSHGATQLARRADRYQCRRRTCRPQTQDRARSASGTTGPVNGASKTKSRVFRGMVIKRDSSARRIG